MLIPFFLHLKQQILLKTVLVQGQMRNQSQSSKTLDFEFLSKVIEINL